MAALGDRWRLIAPDLPGFGYSATPDPERFSYTFVGYGAFLGRFVEALQLDRYALYRSGRRRGSIEETEAVREFFRKSGRRCRIGAVVFVAGVRPSTRGGAKVKEPRS
jgi:pimeloyl-ACP methyl ester carboxylesterase